VKDEEEHCQCHPMGQESNVHKCLHDKVRTTQIVDTTGGRDKYGKTLPITTYHDQGLALNPSNTVFFFPPSGGILHASACKLVEPTIDPSSPPNDRDGAVPVAKAEEEEKGLTVEGGDGIV